MTRKEMLILTIAGLAAGLMLSISFINPHDNQIDLGSLVLQMSGARGEFALGYQMGELIDLNSKLIPYFAFELYMGIRLYRHFCTASVYIFTRTPRRIRWYMREIGILGMDLVYFQGILFLSTIAVAALRFQVQWTVQGIYLLGMHILLFTLWFFALTILVNLAAIKVGSELAFACVFGIQALCIMLLSALRYFEEDLQMFSTLLYLNPVSHLILSWHQSAVNLISTGLPVNLNTGISICYMAGVAVVAAVLGGVMVQFHDLLVSDSEFGGV